MKTILTFILNHCLFLFEDYGFRFVDSLFSKSFGGDAYITLESENIKMRFTFDRRQLLLEFSSRIKSKSSWFSIDLISQLITGVVETSSLVDDYYAKFLEKNMGAINEAFQDENVEHSILELTKFAKERAKHMFGMK
jgi:hypothetical protein